MTVKELIEIINQEGLGKYAIYEIGSNPHDASQKPLASNYKFGGEVEGIYADENGVWKFYFEDERGNIFADKQTYTEDDACKELLESLRRRKQIALEQNRKHFPFGFFR